MKTAGSRRSRRLVLLVLCAPLSLGQTCGDLIPGPTPTPTAKPSLADPGPNDGERQMVYIDFGNRTPTSFVHTVGVDTITRPFSDTNWLTEAPLAAANQIVSRLRAIYAGYNICISSSYESEQAQPYSAVVFVGVAPNDGYIYGGAQHVDVGNRTLNDQALVQTRSTDAAELGHTQAEKCTYIGGKIAHEMGHLLGLHHTADIGDVMRTADWNGQATLKAATVNGSYSDFEGQWQNAPAILNQRLGPYTGAQCPANIVTDSDGDGTPDVQDSCPMDPGKTAPGNCGCGIPETEGCGTSHGEIVMNTEARHFGGADGNGAVCIDRFPAVESLFAEIHFSVSSPPSSASTLKIESVDVDWSTNYIYVNGTTIGALDLDPAGDCNDPFHQGQYTVPASLLHSGDNVLRIDGGPSAEHIFLRNITLVY